MPQMLQLEAIIQLWLCGEPSYRAENNEIYIESRGPEGGSYTLVFELSEKQLKHAHGTYEDQQASGRVEDIKFPHE
jgi:hypothetical protein